MISYFEPNFIEIFLWESGLSNFPRNLKWREMKIGYLAAIFETVQIFNIFFAAGIWLYVFSVYIYMV